MKDLVLKVFDKLQDLTNESSEAEALELLSQLSNPAEVRDDNKWTLLHHACYNGWYEVAKTLIEKYNSDPTCKDSRGKLPLHYACKQGHYMVTEYLVKNTFCQPFESGADGVSPFVSAVND